MKKGSKVTLINPDLISVFPLISYEVESTYSDGTFKCLKLKDFTLDVKIHESWFTEVSEESYRETKKINDDLDAFIKKSEQGMNIVAAASFTVAAIFILIMIKIVTTL